MLALVPVAATTASTQGGGRTVHASLTPSTQSFTSTSGDALIVNVSTAPGSPALALRYYPSAANASTFVNWSTALIGLVEFHDLDADGTYNATSDLLVNWHPLPALALSTYDGNTGGTGSSAARLSSADERVVLEISMGTSNPRAGIRLTIWPVLYVNETSVLALHVMLGATTQVALNGTTRASIDGDHGSFLAWNATTGADFDTSTSDVIPGTITPHPGSETDHDLYLGIGRPERVILDLEMGVQPPQPRDAILPVIPWEVAIALAAGAVAGAVPAALIGARHGMRKASCSRSQDYISSKWNKARGKDDGDDAAGETRAKTYNSSRSNKTDGISDPGDDSGGETPTKAQDHNSSRSNNSSSIEEPGDGTGGDDAAGETRSGINTSRSNIKNQQGIDGPDLDSVKVHPDDAARRANEQAGAAAVEKGTNVQVGSTDLHVAAHEAAHVVQQRSGTTAGSSQQPGQGSSTETAWFCNNCRIPVTSGMLCQGCGRAGNTTSTT